MSVHACPCSHFPPIHFPYSDLSYLCDMNFASHHRQIKNLERLPVPCRVKSKLLRDRQAVSAAPAYLTSCVPGRTSLLFSNREPRGVTWGWHVPSGPCILTHAPPFCWGCFPSFVPQYIPIPINAPFSLWPHCVVSIFVLKPILLLIYLSTWVYPFLDCELLRMRTSSYTFLYLSHSSAQHVFVAACGRSWYNLDCKMLSLM